MITIKISTVVNNEHGAYAAMMEKDGAIRVFAQTGKPDAIALALSGITASIFTITKKDVVMVETNDEKIAKAIMIIDSTTPGKPVVWSRTSPYHSRIQKVHDLRCARKVSMSARVVEDRELASAATIASSILPAEAKPEKVARTKRAKKAEAAKEAPLSNIVAPDDIDLDKYTEV